uniref:Uncharacterized protein n=1 Tax=Nelumbo nucifera TaxID=4432 RepID=A0A822XG69_NELNU|nr:TPA_asm: hypothetical protein HUJ06_020365 [Nelumbo nucifera]
MAEANAATATGTTAEVPKTQPGNTAQNLPSQIPPAQNRKRKLDYADIQNSSYFKIRAIIKDLRPHFVEVTSCIKR